MVGLDEFSNLEIQIENRKGLGWSSGAGTLTFEGQSEEASEGKWDQEIMVSHKLTKDTLSPAKK